MARYEITGCATDIYSLGEIQDALRQAGAVKVSARKAFGWSNQPHVATFAASSDDQAKRLCDAARKVLGPGITARAHTSPLC